MIHTPAEILRRLLVEQGLISDPEDDLASWPATISLLTAVQDKTVALYDTDPLELGRSLDGTFHHMPGFQITVRTGPEGYAEGWEKVQELYGYLTGASPVSVNFPDESYYIYSILAEPPRSMGREPGNRRCLFSCNGSAHITIES